MINSLNSVVEMKQTDPELDKVINIGFPVTKFDRTERKKMKHQLKESIAEKELDLERAARTRTCKLELERATRIGTCYLELERAARINTKLNIHKYICKFSLNNESCYPQK